MNKVVDLTGLSRFWANVDKRKASIDGKYPDLMVGDLVGRGESVPAEFSFRASGGKSIKDGTAWIKRLKGNSVVWNQLLPNSTNPVTSNTTRALNEGTRIVVGHKYLLLADFDGGTDYASVSLFARVSGESKGIIGLGNNENKTYKFFTAEMGGVSNGTGSAEEGNIWQYFYFEGTTESITNTRLIDLTQMFGAGDEPTTIEEFYARKPIVEDEFAYNAGEVIHMTAEGIKSVGDNAWDEEWENGGLDTENGSPYDTTAHFRNKGYIRVIPNTQYYFKKPIGIVTYLFFYDEDKNFVKWLDPFATVGEGGVFTTYNAPYMRFTCYMPTYNHDIMISLVHSGWKQDTDAGYQPYWQDILPLPIIRKYFPDGMKKAGSAHDEIRFNKASGKWEKVQRIGSVDLGTLSMMSWTATANGVEYQYFYTNDLIGIGVPPNYGEVGNAIVAPYTIVSALGLANRELPNKSVMAYNAPGLQVYFRDDDYADAESFKAAMQGVILYYELAEPIVTEITDSFRDYYKVADFGTEQAIAETNSAPISADIIYQFNAVDMIREHELKITELQSIIATMQAQLASLTSNNG